MGLPVIGSELIQPPIQCFSFQSRSLFHIDILISYVSGGCISPDVAGHTLGAREGVVERRSSFHNPSYLNTEENLQQ